MYIQFLLSCNSSSKKKIKSKVLVKQVWLTKQNRSNRTQSFGEYVVTNSKIFNSVNILESHLKETEKLFKLFNSLGIDVDELRVIKTSTISVRTYIYLKIQIRERQKRHTQKRQ